MYNTAVFYQLVLTGRERERHASMNRVTVLPYSALSNTQDTNSIFKYNLRLESHKKRLMVSGSRLLRVVACDSTGTNRPEIKSLQNATGTCGDALAVFIA